MVTLNEAREYVARLEFDDFRALLELAREAEGYYTTYLPAVQAERSRARRIQMSRTMDAKVAQTIYRMGRELGVAAKAVPAPDPELAAEIRAERAFEARF